MTGSRDARDLAKAREGLLKVTAGQHGPHTLVQGGAPGADTLFVIVARRLGWDVETHKADWQADCRPECKHGARVTRLDGVTYCPAAGNYRNQVMVDLGADVAVAMPVEGARNRGTSDCVARAEAAGIHVEVLP